MQFDPNNHIVQLCAKGMCLEGEGKQEEASKLFQQAWEEAADDDGKYVAAHYVARHQQSLAAKLQWDITALNLALNIREEGIKANYPSLYLNVAKGYEDLADPANAVNNYRLALSFTNFLADDDYGKMIRAGIINGLKRVDVLY